MRKKMGIGELVSGFEKAMEGAGYSESSLYNFRFIVNHLVEYTGENGISEYTPVIGDAFLEKHYPVTYDGGLVRELPFCTQYALRTIRLLNDFLHHGSFIRPRRLRGYLPLTEEMQKMCLAFERYCRDAAVSEATIYRRSDDVKKILHYLHGKEIPVQRICRKAVHGYLGTIIGMSNSLVDHHRLSMKWFLRFLHENGYLEQDLSGCLPEKRSIHKSTIPSVWKQEHVEKLLAAVDRGSPLGKRDYAILLLVTKLGMRVGDIKDLKLCDIDWDNNKVCFTQSKTNKAIALPLPSDAGWAIIDYLKYGRLKSDLPNVFLTQRTPVMAFSDTSSLHGIITRYIRLAKIDVSDHKHGMHSLRHSKMSPLSRHKTQNQKCAIYSHNP